MEDDALSDFNSNKASLQRVDHDIREAKHWKNQGELRLFFQKIDDLRLEARYKMTGKWKVTKEESDKRWAKLKQHKEMFDRYSTDPNYQRFFKNELTLYLEFLTEFMGAKGMLLTDKMDDEGL